MTGRRPSSILNNHASINLLRKLRPVTCSTIYLVIILPRIPLPAAFFISISSVPRAISRIFLWQRVDKSDRPLIIDQPDENLDSESVYKLLVPCIKEAKKRRQLIVVTHSPNVAVVCDAEQIIHATIDKQKGNRVEYKTGSIENPDINPVLVDVLEGTPPAFMNRQSKYYTLEP